MPDEIHEISDSDVSLSDLVARVEGAEEIVLARYGQPVARLVPVLSGGGERRPGTLKGSIHYLEGDEIGDTDPELIDLMYRGKIDRSSRS